jgi:uncharacterized protein (TIGR01244 family)
MDQMSRKAVTLRVASVAFVIGLLGMPAAAAEHAPSVAPAVADLKSAVSIFNFGQISPGYYRGGELEGHDADDLARLGVKTVIDLRSDDDYEPEEAQLVSSAHMKYVRIPMTTRVAPTAAQIATFLSIVRDPANQPVYVHCVEGRHRTGVMTAVYRMTVDGWDADRAFDEMKQYKFGLTMFHPEFKKFVYSYHPDPASAPVQATAPVPVTTPTPTPVATPAPASEPPAPAVVAATGE